MGGFDEKWLMNYLRRFGKPSGKNEQMAKVPEQKGLKMNKTEARYEQMVLRPALFAKEIKAYWFESFKLRLADRTWYTPDFVVQRNDDSLWVIEIKGFLRDDAAVKYKVAREQYPCFTWSMLRWRKGDWEKLSI